MEAIEKYEEKVKEETCKQKPLMNKVKESIWSQMLKAIEILLKSEYSNLTKEALIEMIEKKQK